MTRHRDVAAFDVRAPGYESGRRGRLHHEIADRTLRLALATAPDPRRVLDVGCGTGYLLRSLAGRLPEATVLCGVDAAPAMIEVAAAAAARDRPQDGRPAFRQGTAEQLPFPDGEFDLVVSTTSFDHWADQGAGLAECARVTSPGGTLVLVDQFSLLMTPTLLRSRRGKARTRGRAAPLVRAAEYEGPHWHRLYALIIQAVTATKSR